MKKIVIFLSAIILFASNAYAYELSQKDIEAHNLIVKKIESMIVKKGEYLRTKFIDQLQDLSLKHYSNERIVEILKKIVISLDTNPYNNLSEKKSSIPESFSGYSFKNECIGIGVSNNEYINPRSKFESKFIFFGATTNSRELLNQLSEAKMSLRKDYPDTCVYKYGLFCAESFSISSSIQTKGDLKIFAISSGGSEGMPVLMAVQRGNILFIYQNGLFSTQNIEQIVKDLVKNVADYGEAKCNNFKTKKLIPEGDLTDYISKNSKLIGANSTTTNDTSTQTQVKKASSRYPGCNTNDIILGSQTWSLCDVGALKSGDKGEKFAWGNNEPEWKSKYVGYWKDKDQGPCSKGYRIPTVFEFNSFFLFMSDNKLTMKDSLNLSSWPDESNYGYPYWTISINSMGNDYGTAIGGDGYKQTPLYIRCIKG